MARMTETEALMWTVEHDPVLRSDFCNLTIVDGTIDLERLRANLARVVRVIPRLGQRVVESPVRIAAPEWQPVDDFDLDHHLGVVDLPAPGNDRMLLDLCAAIADEPFDRDRPLWRFVVVRGLAGGRNAMLQKVHHSITDGVGGMKLSLELVDFDADAPLRPMPDDEPAGGSDHGAESRFAQAAAALGDVASRAARSTTAALAGAGRVITDPRGNPARVSDALSTAASLRRQLLVTEHAHSDLVDDRCVDRHFELVRIPLQPVRDAAKALGGSINDAYVTIMAGALGEYHRRLGSTVEELRMAMPVNTRGAGGEAATNHFAPSRVLVPIRGTAGERFAETKRRLDTAKHERALGLASSFATMLLGVPAPVLIAVARNQTATIDFATSNLRGSPVPLYLAGARIIANHALGPRTGCALNATVISYCDSLDIGLNLDPLAFSDIPMFLDCIDTSVRDFLAAALVDN